MLFLAGTPLNRSLQVSKGTVALPKSVRPERIASNYEGGIAASQKLDPTDIEELDDIATLKQKRYVMSNFQEMSLSAHAFARNAISLIMPPWRTSCIIFLSAFR
jgi:hypothetical protein